MSKRDWLAAIQPAAMAKLKLDPRKSARHRRQAGALMLAASASAVSASSAMGIVATWTASNSGATWSTSTDWVGGSAPSSSSDTAVFNSAVGSYGTTGSPIIITSGGLSAGAINFDTSAGSFTIGTSGGSTLYLPNGGTVIQILSTFSSTNTATETIAAPINLGTGSQPAFANNSASGTLVISGGITGTSYNGSLVLSGSNTGNNIISGTISGAVGLTKSGTGTWILSGSNTYTGATSISAGTLGLSSASAIGGNSAITVNSGGTLSLLAASSTLGTGSILTMNAGSILSGTGTLTIPGVNTGLNAGAMTINGNTSINGGSGLTVAANNFNGSSRAIYFASGVTLNTTGTVTLNATGSGTSGNNHTFQTAGGVLINASSGTLTINVTPQSADDGAAFGGTATFGGNITFNVLTHYGTYGFSADTTPNISLLNNATLTVNVLAGNSGTYAIPTVGTTWTLGTGATVNVTGTTPVGWTGGTWTVTGGTSSIATPVTLSSATTISNSGTISVSGAISGSGSFTQTGGGTLILSASNSYTGSTTTSGGILEFAAETALYGDNTANWTNAKIIVASGGTLALAVGGAGQFTSSDITTLTALGSASGGFKNGSILGIDTTGGNFTYAGTIANTNSGSNALGLTVLGTNSLTLTASNTYSGATKVSGGTLLANNSTGSATGTSNIKVYGTAKLGGSGTVTGTVTLNGSNTSEQGGFITAGANSSTNGTLTTGNQTWNGGGVYTWKISATGAAGASPSGTPGTSYDQLAISPTVSSGSLLTVSPTGGTAFTIQPTGTITGVANGTYTWEIAQIGTGSSTTILVGGSTLSASSSTDLLATYSSDFALDTNSLSINGGGAPVTASFFHLYFETIGGNNDLVLTYNATPEPTSTLLVLGGMTPLLTARRRKSV